MEEMKQKREKVKQAVALSYDPEEDAPKVIASGRGALAERIIERAKEANVAVHRDDEVVAEILVFVDAMDKIKAKMDAHKK